MEWRVPESQSCGSGVDFGSSPFIPLNSCLSSLVTDCLIFCNQHPLLTLCLVGCVPVELCWVSGSASLLLWHRSVAREEAWFKWEGKWGTLTGRPLHAVGLGFLVQCHLLLEAITCSQPKESSG